jgi:Na+/pantothenate symporter
VDQVPSSVAGPLPLTLLLGVIFATTIKALVEPRQLSRFYALENRKAVRHGTWISPGIFLLVFSLLTPIGLFARRILPPGLEDTDRVVPALLAGGEVFGPFVSAFLFVAMVSAAMSSLDSVLLVVASTCERDLVGLIWKGRSERAILQSTRVYIALFAVVTALVALNPPGGVVSITAFSGSLYAACFLPSLLFGLYWNRGNGRAVLTSYAAGIACLIVWPHLPEVALVHRVFPAVILSTLAYVSVSLLTPPASPVSEVEHSGVSRRRRA